MTTSTRTPGGQPPGWYPDPASRHDGRYWDGIEWTAMVTDSGYTIIDPLPSLPVPRTSPDAAPGPAFAQQTQTEAVPAERMTTEPTTSSPPTAAPFGAVAPGAAPPGIVPPGAMPFGAPPVPTPGARRRNRWLVPLVATVAVLVLVAGLALWAPWSGTTSRPDAPTALRAQASAATSIRIAWTPAAGGGAADRYLIQRNGTEVGSVPSNVTSYLDSALVPGTTYRYTVTAAAGNALSPAASELVARTPVPPVSDGRLQGAFPVSLRITQTDGGTPTVGTVLDTSWSFTPACATGPCGAVLNGNVGGGGYTAHPFTATLSRNGAGYTGTATEHLSQCGSVDLQNSISVRLTVNQAGLVNGNWAATAFDGSMTWSSPYTSVGGGVYCPAQSKTAAITASG